MSRSQRHEDDGEFSGLSCNGTSKKVQIVRILGRKNPQSTMTSDELKDEDLQMEKHILKWLEDENGGPVKRDADGYVEASALAAMRKSRRMGFSEEMVVNVAKKSSHLEVNAANGIRRVEKETRPKTFAKFLSFWFGAANLRRDKFLAKEMRSAEDGMVALEILLNFNKLKNLKATKDELVEAVKLVPELLVLSDDANRVGRVKSLQAEPKPAGSTDDRSVYLEPLQTSTTHEDVAKLMEIFGSIGYISMPRFKTGEIKGFAFVEFDTEAAATASVAASETLSLHDGEQLKVISKADWLKLKGELKDARKAHKERAKHAAQKQKYGHPIGVLLKISGLNDFKRSKPETCLVKFYTASTAAEAERALNSGELQILNCKLVARVLKGREEAEQWDIIHKETEEKAKAQEKSDKPVNGEAKEKHGEDPPKVTGNDIPSQKSSSSDEKSTSRKESQDKATEKAPLKTPKSDAKKDKRKGKHLGKMRSALDGENGDQTTTVGSKRALDRDDESRKAPKKAKEAAKGDREQKQK